MTNAALAIQNWVKIFNEEPKQLQVEIEQSATPTLLECKQQKTKPTSASSSGAFATLRKVYTVGITPQEFLSATSPKENTYFGLESDGPTNKIKERLAILGQILGEALDTGVCFEFHCEHNKERKELLLTLATMLSNDWKIRVRRMYLNMLPPKGEPNEDA